MPTTIVCKECGEYKELCAKGLCKRCYSRQWYKENKEYHRVYYKEHRETILAYRRDGTGRDLQLQRNYGINSTGYSQTLEDQDNHCSICGKTPEENGKRLAVDHNHNTGKVRGLLCSSCNTAVGLFDDSPDNCIRAAAYLEFWKLEDG